MSDPQLRTVCVVAAMGGELKALAARARCVPRGDLPDGWRSGFSGGVRIVLVRGGIAEKAGKAAAEAAAVLSPAALISMGTAGGLDPHFEWGTVVAGNNIASPLDCSASFECDPAVSGAFRRAGAACGGVLSVPVPLCSPRSKAEAAAGAGASVCDMEAWHVAKAAAEAGVPFGALKAISDAAGEALPEISRFFGPGGSVDSRGLALYLSTHPMEAARAARFASRMRRCSEKLAEIMMAAAAHL